MDHAGQPAKKRQGKVDPEVSIDAHHEERGQRWKENGQDDQ